MLDGAKSIGAKILVAGGGRCNVTHDVVDESAYAGSSRHAIRKVLRQFDVPRTIEFFRELDVELKREETGKLFPSTDDARTVLNAMLRAAREAGAIIRYPWRVTGMTKPSTSHNYFTVTGLHDELRARRVILASGGKSLPKTGSDGIGLEIAKTLGHSVTSRVFPALVPLLLPKEHFICGLSGLSGVATLEVRSGKGRKLASFTDSTLCTHFGLSGPSVLDVSRYWTDAKHDDPGATLIINWLPALDVEKADAILIKLGAISPGRWLREQGLPDRLAKALCDHAIIEGSASSHQLTREKRRKLAGTITQLALPVIGDRGFTHAEVTAGGIPLSEIKLETMESRVCPGLHLCGEICDVDGRIGGYNFQWAWASGFVAGKGAATDRP